MLLYGSKGAYEVLLWLHHRPWSILLNLQLDTLRHSRWEKAQHQGIYREGWQYALYGEKEEESGSFYEEDEENSRSRTEGTPLEDEEPIKAPKTTEPKALG